jgi:hypothetical protein
MRSWIIQILQTALSGSPVFFHAQDFSIVGVHQPMVLHCLVVLVGFRARRGAFAQTQAQRGTDGALDAANAQPITYLCAKRLYNGPNRSGHVLAGQ